MRATRAVLSTISSGVSGRMNSPLVSSASFSRSCWATSSSVLRWRTLLSILRSRLMVGPILTRVALISPCGICRATSSGTAVRGGRSVTVFVRRPRLRLVGCPFADDLGLVAVLEDRHRVARPQCVDQPLSNAARSLDIFHRPHLAARVHDDQHVGREATHALRRMKNVVLGDNKIAGGDVVKELPFLIKGQDVQLDLFGVNA